MEPSVVDDVSDAGQAAAIGSTPRREQAKSTITKTTVTPALEPAASEAESRESIIHRLRSQRRGTTPPSEPFAGTGALRVCLSVMLGLICLLNVAGSILMLLLWQQNRASGVLTSQVERTWDFFDVLREIERWVALTAIPVAVAWAVLAAINIRRATGKRPSPIIAGLSIVIGSVGVWVAGDQIIGATDSWSRQALGWLAQAGCIVVPFIVLENLADDADAQHRPLRSTVILAVGYVALLQFLAGLSTVDQTSGADQWGRLGAYLMIGAMVLVLGSLSANEAGRSIEEGTDHRFHLRHRFGESLLAQAEQ
jgi:hypothetical protein